MAMDDDHEDHENEKTTTACGSNRPLALPQPGRNAPHACDGRAVCCLHVVVLMVVFRRPIESGGGDLCDHIQSLFLEHPNQALGDRLLVGVRVEDR